MCTGSEREVRINCVHACVHAGSEDLLLAVESGERSKACWLLACLLSGEKKLEGALHHRRRERV